MDITWLGHSCFRIKTKEAVIVADPYDASTGYHLGKVSADIVTISHGHHDHNNAAAITAAAGGEELRVVDGPGEYEIKGILITGIQTFHDSEGGKKRGKNTAYLIEAEDMVVCHLGDLGHIPTEEQIEEMSNADILMIPVGGNYTINAVQAAEVISLVEPKIVIPMHYKTEVLKLEVDSVDKFCREMGIKPPQPQPKLSVNKSSLPAEQQVVLLEYRK